MSSLHEQDFVLLLCVSQNKLLYIFRLKILFAALAYFLIIHDATEAIDNQLYHTDLSELEVSVNPYNTSHIISQHKILEVPKWCSKTTTCQGNENLAQGLHNYCFKNECTYSAYYCLQGSLTSVHFCAHFNKCSPHTRHLAKINESFPDYIDIYEVACPDGHVQPNEQHGCFSLCVPDNSKIELESTYTHDSGVSNKSIRTVLNTGRSDITIEDKSKVPNQDNPDEADDNGQDIPKHDKPYGLKGRDTEILIVVSIIALMVIVIVPLWLVCKYCRSSKRNDQSMKGDTRIEYSVSNVTKNNFNLDNGKNVVINVGDNGRQSEPLLANSSSCAYSNVCDETNSRRNYNNDPAMDNLKDEHLVPDTKVLSGCTSNGRRSIFIWQPKICQAKKF